MSAARGVGYHRVSIHAYAYLSDRYALLSSGASMGDKYGPTMGRRAYTKDELGRQRSRYRANDERISGDAAVHGVKRGTDYVVVPFDEIFDYLRAGKAEAGLIIHEGQLTYGGEGFKLRRSGGMVARGNRRLAAAGNAIRRDLGEKSSGRSRHPEEEHVVWSDHRADGLAYARRLGRGLRGRLDGSLNVCQRADATGERARAVREFLSRGACAAYSRPASGLLDSTRTLDSRI